MAKKPARKSRPDANGSAPKPTKANEPKPAPATTPEHPALTLFHALNALHTVCSNARLFAELAERRKQARDMQLNFLNLRGKIASDRANELARADAPREQQWAALTEGMDRANDPPPSNEPAEYTKSLRENILDHGRSWCERARAAMRAGGAKGLDAATHPNAAGQARSIELHTKLQDAERVFVGLTIGVGDPRIIIDKDAASMADLGAWFARTRDELGAVFETRGLDAPAPTPTVSVSPDLLDRLQRAAAAVDPGVIDRAAERAAEKVARVFGGGDNGDAKPTDPTIDDFCRDPIISTDTFARVRDAAGIKVKLKGAAARNRRYNPSEVERLIAAALAGNFIERTAMAEKWARWGSKKAASKPHASK